MPKGTEITNFIRGALREDGKLEKPNIRLATWVSARLYRPGEDGCDEYRGRRHAAIQRKTPLAMSKAPGSW